MDMTSNFLLMTRHEIKHSVSICSASNGEDTMSIKFIFSTDLHKSLVI